MSTDRSKASASGQNVNRNRLDPNDDARILSCLAKMRIGSSEGKNKNRHSSHDIGKPQFSRILYDLDDDGGGIDRNFGQSQSDKHKAGSSNCMGAGSTTRSQQLACNQIVKPKVSQTLCDLPRDGGGLDLNKNFSVPQSVRYKDPRKNPDALDFGRLNNNLQSKWNERKPQVPQMIHNIDGDSACFSGSKPQQRLEKYSRSAVGSIRDYNDKHEGRNLSSEYINQSQMPDLIDLDLVLFQNQNNNRLLSRKNEDDHNGRSGGRNRSHSRGDGYPRINEGGSTCGSGNGRGVRNHSHTRGDRYQSVDRTDDLRQHNRGRLNDNANNSSKGDQQFVHGIGGRGQNRDSPTQQLLQKQMGNPEIPNLMDLDFDDSAPSGNENNIQRPSGKNKAGNVRNFERGGKGNGRGGRDRIRGRGSKQQSVDYAVGSGQNKGRGRGGSTNNNTKGGQQLIDVSDHGLNKGGPRWVSPRRDKNDQRPNDNNQIIRNHSEAGTSDDGEWQQSGRRRNTRRERENVQHSTDSGHNDRPELQKRTDNRRTRFFGYKMLESLVDMKAHEIIPTLLNPNSGFETMLKSKLNTDWLYMLIRITRTICTSEFTNNRTSVLSMLCDSTVLESLSMYIGEMPIERNSTRIASMADFVDGLVTFFDTVVHTLPTNAANLGFDTLIRKLAIAVVNIDQLLKVTVNEAVVEKLEKLKLIMDHWNEAQEKHAKSNNKSSMPLRSELLAELDAPDNFRDLSLYPVMEDLKRGCMGFVRPNIVHGAYRDVEHYLDVQFRLLREDFISPLREGIQAYIKRKAMNDKKNKYENVRFYRNVKFLKAKTTENAHVGYIVNFSQNSKMNTGINWEYNKRFMYGSMLVFTVDDFNSFILCTVLDRDLKMLKNGEITVAPVGNNELSDAIFNESYTMAESEVFYEPYYLVMRALHNLNETNFPMKEYIVDADTTPFLPRHIVNQPQWNIGGHSIVVNDFREWPTAAFLKFDNHQFEAYRHALTHEFTIIQGPPGTGKTFIGLKIMETIIKNFKMPNSPVLVVCYTNHALDQFLEGCLQFTKSIVRIGGQSKSDVLNKYNLKQIARIRGDAHYTAAKIRFQMDNLMRTIAQKEKDSESIFIAKGILSLDYLKPVLGPYGAGIESNQQLLYLLLEDTDTEIELPNREHIESQVEHLPEGGIDENEFDELSVFDDDELEDALEEPEDLLDEFNYKDIKETATAILRYSFSIDNMAEYSSKLRRDFEELHSNSRTQWDAGLQNQLYELQMNIREIEYKSYMIQINVRAMDETDEKRLKSLRHDSFWNYNIQQRWSIYRYWLNELHKRIQLEIKECESRFRQTREQYKELRQMEDLMTVQSKKIVGMTTTGAARLQVLLNALKPAIVIVEEAAEVLEAHIVVTLTKECQHLILIGDHKQLRPSAAVYELSKHFNIDVSLFERMIKNGMRCPKLNVQHRMRPEIAAAITPFIYPGLENDPSVMQFPPVRGVSKNLFFVDHQQLEIKEHDSSSKKNIHEADFAINLCRYIVLQGYEPEKVTILTTYTGQMYYLREQRKTKIQNLLKAVKIIVVDKYQGEENDIIILSLVRSNEENKIGFLNIENRVCVALTRAKIGFYMIGNMSLLSLKSKLWSNIKEYLVENQSFGPELILYCALHDKQTAVSKKEHFHAVAEGGCSDICNIVMDCGHNCRKSCHAVDREHADIRCYEKCFKSCPEGHPCKDYCYKKCSPCNEMMERTLVCGHKVRLHCHIDVNTYQCTKIIEVVLPSCGHTAKKKCHIQLEEVKCTVQCIWRLDCGHSCTRHCHVNDDPDHLKYICKKPCERLNAQCSENHQCQLMCFEDCGKCQQRVLKKLSCGHEQMLQCSVGIEKIKCFVTCNKKCVSCDFPCLKKCHEDCYPCTHVVKKTIPSCGHEINVMCSEEPRPNLCKAKCERLKPCGHPCKSACGKPCNTELCKARIDCKIELPCHHDKANIPCHMQSQIYNRTMTKSELTKFCAHPCDTILKCGDLCGGTCGKCYQGRLHTLCDKECGTQLICGHVCGFPCREVCPPCMKCCNYNCIHSKCKKMCGEPCSPCLEPCPWQCKHQTCTKKCGFICNRSPCEEPCEKVLNCGHPCIGFCGETCPPLCRVCNEEEVTTIFLGFEDEPDARFVYLEDCKHTIESQGLEYSLSVAPEGGEIVMKVCPLCKTPISKTLRFMNYVKKTYQHITNIKKKIYGNRKQADELGKDILSRLEALKQKQKDFDKLGWHIMQHVNRFSSKIGRAPSKKNPHWKISNYEMSAIHFFLDFFEKMAVRIPDCTKIIVSQRSPIEEWTNIVLERIANGQSVNSQQREDFDLEIRRFHRLVDFAKIRSVNGQPSQLAESLQNLLLEPMRYSLEKDIELEQSLVKLRASLQMQPLTAAEKEMINKAMAPSFYGDYTGKGHWYTCPNGHYYVITECGGATQTAKCPECNAVIGGSGHRLVESSRVAEDFRQFGHQQGTHGDIRFF